MKAKTYIGLGLLVVLVIVSFLFYNEYKNGNVVSLTQYYNSGTKVGSLSFATTSTGGVTVGYANGDIYYESRCEDISSYLATGDVFLRNDSGGCPISGKATVLASQNIGQRSSFCYKGSFRSCGSGCTTSAPDPCGQLLGSSWTGSCIGSSTAISGGTSLIAQINCNLNGYTEHGGLVRVQNTCAYASNQLLAAETFNAGSTITKLSTRYPIAGFCMAHPALITDSSTQQTVTSTNIQQDLLDGKSVSVGSSQTLTLFYILDNNKNLPTVCDSTQNLALDVNANATVCKSTLGFTYFCSQGVFDSKTGTCVVQPATATVCIQGRYDITQNKCVYNPPIQYDCGSTTATYDVDRNVCVEYSQEVFSCNTGFTLVKPTQSECTAKNGVWQLCPQCPAGKVCPQSICQPRCSTGVECTYSSPLVQTCNNANATINSNGQCQIQGETIFVCPSNSEFDKSSNKCVSQYDSNEICSDGSQPTTNIITQKKECVVTVTKFVNCPVTQVYDQNKNACVDKIQVFDSSTQTPVLYSETRTGCSTTLSCSDGQICNTQLNICQIPVGQKLNYSRLLLFAGILLVIAFILYKMIRSKKKR